MERLLSNKYFAFVVLGALEIFRIGYSMKPNFWKDIDLHCYKYFAKEFLSGERTYKNFHCDHGLMYYPASHAYFYGIIYFLVNSDQAVQLVEGIIFFLVSMYSIDTFYEYMFSKTETPSSSSSKKQAANADNAGSTLTTFKTLLKFLFLVGCILGVQTIYRTAISYAGNDLQNSLFVIVMMNALKRKQYWLCSFMYTLSVSYKMNTLFYGPILLMIYLHSLSFVKVIIHFGAMGIFQLAAAFPFLIHDYKSYLSIAFNFSREFDSEQNLAWSFLGDDIRRTEPFYKFLFAFTAGTLLCYLFGLHKIMARLKQLGDDKRLTEWKLLGLVAGNFLCFIWSRGLHVQFSLWIFFSLPFLLFEVFIKPREEHDATATKQQRTGVATWVLLILGLVLLIFMLDWTLANPRNIIQPMIAKNVTEYVIQGDYGKATKYLFDDDAAIFGRLKFKIPQKIVELQKQNWDMPLYYLLGYHYEVGYSWTHIPSSLVLFLIEVLVAVKIFQKMAGTLTQLSLRQKRE